MSDHRLSKLLRFQKGKMRQISSQGRQELPEAMAAAVGPDSPGKMVKIPAGEAGLESDSKALCEQIRSVSRKRLIRRAGTLSASRMGEIRQALDRHLWL